MAAPRTKPPLILAPDDRAWLESLRRSRMAPLRQVERAEILIRYADGQSTWAIRRQTGFFSRKVHRCIEKAPTAGPAAALEDLPRPGRPRQLTDADRAWIIGLACQKPRAFGYVYFVKPFSPFSSRQIPHRSDLPPEKWTQEKDAGEISPSPNSDTGGETRHPPHHRPNTQAFKLPGIRTGLEDHQAVRAVARQFAVDHSLVRYWLRRSDEGGEPARQDRRGPPDPRPPRRLPPGLSLAEDKAGLQAENASLKPVGARERGHGDPGTARRSSRQGGERSPSGS